MIYSVWLFLFCHLNDPSLSNPFNDFSIKSNDKLNNVVGLRIGNDQDGVVMQTLLVNARKRKVREDGLVQHANRHIVGKLAFKDVA